MVGNWKRCSKWFGYSCAHVYRWVVVVLYSIGALHYHAWEREREKVSRRLGGWVQEKIMKEKERIGRQEEN